MTRGEGARVRRARGKGAPRSSVSEDASTHAWCCSLTGRIEVALDEGGPEGLAPLPLNGLRAPAPGCAPKPSGSALSRSAHLASRDWASARPTRYRRRPATSRCSMRTDGHGGEPTQPREELDGAWGACERCPDQPSAVNEYVRIVVASSTIRRLRITLCERTDSSLCLCPRSISSQE